MTCNNGFQLLPHDTLREIHPYQTGAYAVIVSNDWCIDTSTCYSLIGTGIDNLSTDGIKIYPNPTTCAQLILSFDRAINKREVKVFDISGRLCMKQLVPSIINKVDVHALTNGTYSLIIEEDGRKLYSKFVKE
jgi:hypothetical protein